ncbi:MAG TPA: ParB/RepB/Spo0J family partition protein [Thermomicrobiales bacterium]|nr:ParB/RepB/Spo0J family partition protein [Thermomicrobiales bacterium]
MQRVFRIVDTADLTPMDLKPSDRMVQSVRRHGVLTPLLLRERVDEDGVIALEIVDGNRRVWAAKEAGLEKVPAVVYQGADSETLAAATLITNTLRSRNAVSEWQAVERLSDLGHDAAWVMRLTGLTKASLETRLRPSTMHPDLRRAMEEGRISVTVWERAGRLPPEAQQRLADTLEHRGGLRLADVDAERERLEAVESPRDDVDVPDLPEKPGTREQLEAQLSQLARFARSVGLGEYDWSRITTSAWRQSEVPEEGTHEPGEPDISRDDERPPEVEA